MFIAQRMKKIDMLIVKKLSDEVSREIVKFGDFQSIEIPMEKAKSLMLSKSATDAGVARFADLDKRINYLITTFESIMENLEMWKSEEITESGMTDTETLEKNVKSIETELNVHNSELERLRNDQKEAKIRIKKINYFYAQDIDWSRAENLRFFDIGFGSIPLTGYDGFDSAMQTLPTIVEKIDTVGDVAIVFYMAPASIKDKVGQILKSVYFKDYGIPRSSVEAGKSALVHYAFELSAAYDEELWQEKQFKKSVLGYRTLLKTLKNSAQYYIAMERLKGEMVSSGKVCIFSGWVPSKVAHKLEKKMELITENKCVFLEQSASKVMDEEGLMPPTKFNNPFFIKPFEMLTSTFGTPNYREIDPTPIMAVTFILMYGAMFGDAGQGLVIVLLGGLVLLFKKFKAFSAFGPILIYAGLSAAFFGLMYGAIFGFENVLKPVWINPMEHINDILMISVGYGSLVILCAILLNIINSIMERNYGRLLFSTNGLAGLGFYGSLIFVALCAIRGIHYPSFVFVITGACAILIALEKSLERWLFGRHGHGAGEEKPSIGLGFIEMYEAVMGFLSNTISYIRVGAFALNHIALMSVGFIFAYSSKEPAVQWIVLLLWNLFIIGFEGFIVFIQVIRLEYYEFFTRFFRADGKAFEGIGIYKP